MRPAMTPQQSKFTDPHSSSFALYKELVVGKRSGVGHFILYELLTLFFSGLPGLLGYSARTLSYPYLFASCGRRPGLGRSVTVRNPKSITLGNKVVIDDFASLDVRGDSGCIILGDHVAIGRFSCLVARGGKLSLGSGVNIGSYCRLGSQSSLEIGDSTLIAAYCYLGPGNHQTGDGVSLIENEMQVKGGVKIGSHVWLGTKVTVLDGVTIGDGAIIGAHSLVKDDVPAGAIAVGTPARVIKMRD